MTINPISNNNISFKSQIAPTDEMKEAFRSAKLNLDDTASYNTESAIFLKNLKVILNDGKDDVIALRKRQEPRNCQSDYYDITVNDIPVYGDILDSDYTHKLKMRIINDFTYEHKNGYLPFEHQKNLKGLEKKMEEAENYLKGLQMLYAQQVKEELENIEKQIFDKTV